MKSTSQDRLLPRHQNVCEMNISSCSGMPSDLKSICADLELAVAGVVVASVAASMIASVSTPESWIETVGLVGSSPTRISPTHARPGPELLGDDLMLPARNAGADRAVVQGGQPHAGHVLERLDPVHQGGQQQALDEPVVVLEALAAAAATSGSVLARSRSTSRSIWCCCSSIGQQLVLVELLGVLEVHPHHVGERLVAVGHHVPEVAQRDHVAQPQRVAPIDQQLEHDLQGGALPLRARWTRPPAPGSGPG